MIENFLNSTKFVQNLVKFNNEEILKLEKKSIEENVPIITRDVLKFMVFMANSINAKNILEIGTAVGYSGIFLANIAKSNEGKLTTIEIDDDRYEKSKLNFKKFKLEKYVNSIKGDAVVELPKLNGNKYDFIFIDASKSKYKDFFEYSYNMLNDGGIIFIDNIMFRGYVAESDTPKRYKTIINNLKNFISYLNDNTDFVLLPYGDGVGLVRK
jgi:O-methyltransferase family 3